MEDIKYAYVFSLVIERTERIDADVDGYVPTTTQHGATLRVVATNFRDAMVIGQGHIEEYNRREPRKSMFAYDPSLTLVTQSKVIEIVGVEKGEIIDLINTAD